MAPLTLELKVKPVVWKVRTPGERGDSGEAQSPIACSLIASETQGQGQFRDNSLSPPNIPTGHAIIMLISKIRRLRTENPAPSHTAKGQVLWCSLPRSLEGDVRSAGSWRPGRHRKREEELSGKPVWKGIGRGGIIVAVGPRVEGVCPELGKP